MGFIVIYSVARVNPSRELFDYFFTTNRDPEGWISISPRVVKEGSLLVSNERPKTEATTTSLIFSGGSKDLDDWKERYVFTRP